MSDFNGNHEILTTDPTTGVARKIPATEMITRSLSTNTAVMETYTGTGYIPYIYAIVAGFPTSQNGVITP
jgi:hypothetical protein